MKAAFLSSVVAALLSLACPVAAFSQTTVPAALPVGGRVAYATVPGGSYTQITNPGKFTRDAAGNIFILDVGKPQVLEIPVSGPLQIIIPSTDSVMTANAGYHATRMTVDQAGNIYIASTYNGVITKISRNTNGTYNLGASETAVTYTGACGSDGGNGLGGTQDFAIDTAGNFYIAVNGTAQKGIVALGPSFGTCKYIFGNNTNTPAVNAPPLSVTVDGNGNVFYVDGAAVQEITAAQVAAATVTTPAVPTPIGNGACTGCTALTTPQAVTFDAVGNLLIGQTTSNALVLLMPLNTGFSSSTPIYNMPSNMSAHIGTAAYVTTNNQGDYFAANGGSVEIYGQGSYQSSTSANVFAGPFTLPAGNSTTTNPATQYLFTQATTLATPFSGVVPDGAPYGGLGATYPTFKYSSTGCVASQTVGSYCNPTTVYAPTFPGGADGGIALYGTGGAIIGVSVEQNVINGSIATIDTGFAKPIGTGLTMPLGVAVDPSGNMYVADQGAGAVYRYAPGASTSTAGTSVVASYGTGVTPASLSSPSGVAIDAVGDVFIADTGNNRILYLPTSSAGTLGAAQVVAVTGFTLNAPRGVAFDGFGKLYIADTGNARIIRMANPLTTNITVPSVVGTNYTSPFTSPYAMAFDQYQNMYVADFGANAIVIVPGGYGFSATSTTNYGSGNGTNTASTVPVAGVSPSTLSGPTGIAVDASGSVYVSDSGNSRVLKIPQTGAVFATAPNVGVYGNAVALFTASANMISKPSGLAIDVTGDLFFTDANQPGLYFAQRSQPSGSTSVLIPLPLPDVTTTTNSTGTAILSNGGYITSMTETVTAPATPYSLTTNGCNNASLAAGATCTDVVTLTGSAAGALDANNAGTLVFTTNEQGLASQTATATLSGYVTGAVATVTIAGNTSIKYGQTVTYTVTAADSGGKPTGAANGPQTVTITGCGSFSPTVTISGGVGSFILPSVNVGTCALSVTIGGVTGTLNVTVAKAPLAATATSFSRIFDQPNPTLTYSYVGLVNGDSASVVTGTPVLSTTATRLSPAGSYPITIGGTLSAANYTITFVNGTLTVTGSAPQIVEFDPLPGFTGGTAVTLVGISTSGLPLVYTTSAGTINGNVLTVPATGTAVTVTASQPGNSNYAAATSVARSFTAQ